MQHARGSTREEKTLFNVFFFCHSKVNSRERLLDRCVQLPPNATASRVTEVRAREMVIERSCGTNATVPFSSADALR